MNTMEAMEQPKEAILLAWKPFLTWIPLGTSAHPQVHSRSAQHLNSFLTLIRPDIPLT